MNIEKDDVKRLYRLTDINFTAFLLIHKDSFELVDMTRKFDEIKRKSQCVFILENKSDIDIKRWILDYQNDKIKVSIHDYNKKLDDLRDLINSNAQGE